MGDGTVSLRCKHCGAPLDIGQLSSDSTYVTCEYCGTSQQRIDAEKYMQDMMNEARSWALASMPNGYTMGSGDSVATHAVFVKDVAPKLRNEVNSLRFGMMSVLGNCLIALPYKGAASFSAQHTSERVYAFAEKVKMVSELAGTDEDRALIEEANAVSQTYALALNNVALMGEEKDGKWLLMSHNFTLASEVVGRYQPYQLVAKRLAALSQVCEGFEKLLNADPVTAYGMIRTGKEGMDSIKEEVLKDSSLAIMYAPMGQEISIANTMVSILGFSTAMGGDAVKMMQMIKAVVTNEPKSSAPWSASIKGMGRYDEIFGEISEAVAALGTGDIPVAAGPGDILIPFWEVDLRYTFVTGKLWAKKSVEVKEDLLICADFPIDAPSMNDPSNAITDIFKLKPPTTIRESWGGNQTSISSSEGIGDIQDSVAMGNAGGRRIMVPLSTKREADRLCVEYITRKASNDKAFKLSEPIVKRLIYVPFVDTGNGVTNAGFGNAMPERMKRFDTKSELIIG